MADNSSSNVSLSVPPSLNLFLLQMKWEKMSQLMSSMQRIYKPFCSNCSTLQNSNFILLASVYLDFGLVALQKQTILLQKSFLMSNLFLPSK